MLKIFVGQNSHTYQLKQTVIDVIKIKERMEDIIQNEAMRGKRRKSFQV